MKVETKQFAVIGLGHFGIALCRELAAQGAQVLAIDRDEHCVKKVMSFVSAAVVADCADENTVSELKLADYDIVMVAIGDDINGSILTCLLLKELGVKTVWVKAKDANQAKILAKIGVDRIIMPERDMGERIARNMLEKRVFDYLQLGSGLVLAEVVVGHDHLGSPLCQHVCLQHPQVLLLALKRGPQLRQLPQPDTSLEIGDILIIAGEESVVSAQLKRL